MICTYFYTYAANRSAPLCSGKGFARAERPNGAVASPELHFPVTNNCLLLLLVSTWNSFAPSPALTREIFCIDVITHPSYIYNSLTIDCRIKSITQLSDDILCAVMTDFEQKQRFIK